MAQFTPLANSAGHNANYDFIYYLKGALAGGVCCGITHGGTSSRLIAVPPRRR